MPRHDVDICNEIVRRSIFFSEELGTICHGDVIPGVAPISEVLDANQDLMPVLSSTDQDFKQALLSRIFVLYNTRPEDVRHRTAALVNKTNFAIRLISAKADHEVITTCGLTTALLLCPAAVLPRDVLLVVYAKNLSVYSLAEQKRLLSQGHIKQQLVDLIASLSGTTSFTRPYGQDDEQHRNNILCVARYNTAEKPLLHQVLDSVFYMESSALLTGRERVLRYVTTILLFPTIVMPLACFVLFLGRQHRARYAAANLTRWQYAQHKQRLSALRSVSALLRDASSQTAVYRESIFQLLISRGYLDATLRPTPEGKKTSAKHNLMLATANHLLTTKQRVARCIFWTTLALTIAGSLAHSVLIALPLVNETRAFTAFVTASVSGLLSAGVFAFHIQNKTAKFSIMGVIVIAAIGLASISAIFYISEQLPIAQNKISALTALIMVCAMAVVGVSLIENLLLHRKDRATAEELGMSLTAYLDVKPHLDYELRKCDDDHMLASACLNALRAGGADIRPLLLDNPEIEQCIAQSETPLRAA